MEYNPWGAFWTGLSDGIVVALVLYPALAIFRFGLDPLGFLGGLVPVRNSLVVYTVGGVAFLALAVAFALVYAGLYEAIGIERGELWWGLLFGVFHWAADGALLGVASRRHPGILARRVTDPGLFALGMSTEGAIAFLGAHLLYGGLAVNFYSALR